MQLDVHISGKLSLIEDIPVLLKNGVKMVSSGCGFFLNAPEQKLLETKKTLESAGIQIHSVHAPFGNKDNLIALDSKVRKQAIQRHKKLLSQLSIAGVGIMVFHIGTVENERHESSAFSIAAESLSSLAKAAEKYQVILALENTPIGNAFPRGLCTDSQILLKLLKKIDSSYLKVCFDTGHAHLGEKREKIKEAIKNLSDWIVAIHIQDNGGDADRHLQPGYGTIDWDDFIKALQDISYDGPLTIESEPWGGASIRCMMNEVRALLKDAGANIPTNLTLRPNKIWLNNFPKRWGTNKAADIIIRCRKCGHYVIWTPEEGRCACDEKRLEQNKMG